jgi:ion channel-forming bestrophin family protein
MLPFCVISYFSYVSILVVTGIAASFMLIEKMAIHLQDPFENKPTDTPMTAIAATIERDLMQILHEEKQLPERTDHKHSYYIL